MPAIDLPQGTVHVRVAGPDASTAPPVVFVHGFLVDGTLWSRTAAALAEAGVRSYAPDLPLGSHRLALRPDADRSPRGVAQLVLDLLAALELTDVTLVGNDTGGALCQFLLDRDASRIGRVVLTNCDAFDTFPPAPFDLVMKAFRSERAIAPLLLPMRAAAVRHSPAGFGLLVRDPLDADQTRAWIEPAIADAGVRRDVASFVREVRPADLLDVSTRLRRFGGPVTLVWGAADRFFTLDLGRRLRDAFADARLVEVAGARTFLPLDEPRRLADEILAASRAGAAA